jgi:hypothetical protein
VLGSGPTYPDGFDASSTLPPASPVFRLARWKGYKTSFLTSPSYQGPLLIRGHQLNGPYWVGFEVGARPLAELPTPSVRDVYANPHEWRFGPTTETRIRAPGCYAYQIDGTTFSEVVVFRVSP